VRQGTGGAVPVLINYLLLLVPLFLTSCGGGGGGTSTGGGTGNPSGPVTISGSASYEFVPHYNGNNSSGWDFGNSYARPIRGATVEAVDANNLVLASDQTDENGRYSLVVDPNTQVLVRVKAELLSTSPTSWDISVTDNTSNYALYVMEGSIISSGTSNSTRNLLAETGWGGSSYTAERAAAPFAILDTAYTVVQMLAAADPSHDLPRLQLNWSENNNTSDGDVENGDISSSHYDFDGTTSQIYLLGDSASDADEFDPHVVAHEMGHYFEHRYSRIDNIGGAHFIGDYLDFRVAYSEGLASAFAAMALNDPIYKDGYGSTLYAGFSFSLEDNYSSSPNPGWFNESSVQVVLYDLFDSSSDGIDNLSLGFEPIYQTIADSSLENKEAMMSIFTFREAFDDQFPAYSSQLASLLNQQAIQASDQYGSGETNDLSLYSGTSSVLPLYRQLNVNGPAVNVCSTDDYDPYSEGNKAGTVSFLRFNIAMAGNYQTNLSLTKATTSSTDPDFYIYQRGNAVGVGDSADDNTETANTNLTAGNYVMEVYHYGNIDDDDTNNSKACFDVTLSQL